MQKDTFQCINELFWKKSDFLLTHFEGESVFIIDDYF